MDNQLPTITTAKRGELAMISPVYCQASSPTPSVNIDGGALIPLRRDTNPVELTGVVPALTGHSQMALAIGTFARSEEHTSELQSLMSISYAVFCLKKKIIK